MATLLLEFKLAENGTHCLHTAQLREEARIAHHRQDPVTARLLVENTFEPRGLFLTPCSTRFGIVCKCQINYPRGKTVSKGHFVAHLSSIGHKSLVDRYFLSWGDQGRVHSSQLPIYNANHKCIPDNEARSMKQDIKPSSQTPLKPRANPYEKKRLDNNQCLLSWPLLAAPAFLPALHLISSAFLFHLSKPTCAGGVCSSTSGW